MLGTGTVGRAFVARHVQLRERGVLLPALGCIANSRAVTSRCDDPAAALQQVNASTHQSDGARFACDADALSRGDIVIDATASDAIAGQHADWLARGIHVVTANKLGMGAGFARARTIRTACDYSGAHYGDNATVGAGLPLLRSIRELVRGGDRIHAIEGVLSGSLAWLFNHYDGMRPFSGFVREARAAGYTEPDPRIDLSGEDVRRKLLILARAAGLSLEAEDVAVDSLVPKRLAAVAIEHLDAKLPYFDTPLRKRFQQAYRDNASLRFIGRIDASGASVGLRALPADHPLCGGSGTDNRVAITSCRYQEQPLVIQGPGAGAEVTAAALLDDVLRIASP
ncbi:MAG: homoserine dehydrogenase [Lysobacter sp.]|nr:homoserine dehydrogenase [Lysobacter sp.]